MIDLSNIKNYYIACGYTDLRRGIDGLAQIVMNLSILLDTFNSNKFMRRSLDSNNTAYA